MRVINSSSDCLVLCLLLCHSPQLSQVINNSSVMALSYHRLINNMTDSMNDPRQTPDRLYAVTSIRQKLKLRYSLTNIQFYLPFKSKDNAGNELLVSAIYHHKNLFYSTIGIVLPNPVLHFHFPTNPFNTDCGCHCPTNNKDLCTNQRICRSLQMFKNKLLVASSHSRPRTQLMP